MGDPAKPLMDTSSPGTTPFTVASRVAPVSPLYAFTVTTWVPFQRMRRVSMGFEQMKLVTGGCGTAQAFSMLRSQTADFTRPASMVGSNSPESRITTCDMPLPGSASESRASSLPALRSVKPSKPAGTVKVTL